MLEHAMGFDIYVVFNNSLTPERRNARLGPTNNEGKLAGRVQPSVATLGGYEGD